MLRSKYKTKTKTKHNITNGNKLRVQVTLEMVSAEPYCAFMEISILPLIW